MEKYLEATPEELEAARNKLIADKLEVSEDDVNNVTSTLSDEVKDDLEVAISKIDESLFDELFEEEMSLLEKVDKIINTMKLKKASVESIVEAISVCTGMKLEEALEVYKGL